MFVCDLLIVSTSSDEPRIRDDLNHALLWNEQTIHAFGAYLL